MSGRDAAPRPDRLAEGRAEREIPDRESAMSLDSIGRPAGPPPTPSATTPPTPSATTPAGPRRACAIAAVRGDVTTMRAAALVAALARARGRDPGAKAQAAEAQAARAQAARAQAARAMETPAAAPPAFPAHLLRAGPG